MWPETNFLNFPIISYLKKLLILKFFSGYLTFFSIFSLFRDRKNYWFPYCLYDLYRLLPKKKCSFTYRIQYPNEIDHYYYPHLRGKEVEVQGSKTTCPKIPSWSFKNPGLESWQSCSRSCAFTTTPVSDKCHFFH